MKISSEYYSDSTDFIFKTKIKLEKQDIISHLENIVHLLHTHKNFEVLFVNEYQVNELSSINFICKENYASLVNAKDFSISEPFNIISWEGNLTQGVEQFFYELIEYIPKNNRERNLIIKKLEKLISHLNKK